MAHDAIRRAMADALRRYPVDIIHLHGLDFADYVWRLICTILGTGVCCSRGLMAMLASCKRCTALPSRRLRQGRLDEFSEALERLHQERWHEEGYQGALSSGRDRSFHREVAGRFLAAKMLMFYGIRMGSKLIAAIYGYRVRDRIYSYLSGFDPEYARQSGKHLNWLRGGARDEEWMSRF